MALGSKCTDYNVHPVYAISPTTVQIRPDGQVCKVICLVTPVTSSSKRLANRVKFLKREFDFSDKLKRGRDRRSQAICHRTCSSDFENQWRCACHQAQQNNVLGFEGNRRIHKRGCQAHMVHIAWKSWNCLWVHLENSEWLGSYVFVQGATSKISKQKLTIIPSVQRPSKNWKHDVQQ